MARSAERPIRAHAGPDHVGRHRPAGREDEAGAELGSEGAEPGSPVAEPGGPGPGAPGPEAMVVPLFSVPDSLRSVDVAVGGRAVRGLLLVTVVLLLTLGGRWWWVSQQAAGTPVEQQVVSAGPVGAGAGSASGAGEGSGVGDDSLTPAEGGAGPEVSVRSGPAPAATGPAGAPSDRGWAPGGGGADPSAADHPAGEAVMVHVIGEVLEPGVVELPPGSRVIDAVRAAGGVTDHADPASLNLARPVVDGEQVWVGAPGEEPPPWLQSGPGSPGAGASGAGGGPGSGQPGAGADGGQGALALVVDLNLADQAQLEELPGVGPVTAGNILAWREQHGRFTAAEELMEVGGIGEKTFERLRPHVTVGG